MRWKLAVLWVGAQVLFFCGWVAMEQQRLTTGPSILVRTAPVDPRDLLRGQYLALSYEFSRAQNLADTGQPAAEGSEVWTVLGPSGEFHVPRQSYARRPGRLSPGEVAVLGRQERWRIVYGIEAYFVPEGTATPEMRDTTVRLRVGNDGKLRIEQVYVRGKPWP